MSALVVLAEPGENFGWPLAQVARAAHDFELLPRAVGEDFDLRTQAGLVVGQAFEVDLAARGSCCRPGCAAPPGRRSTASPAGPLRDRCRGRRQSTRADRAASACRVPSDALTSSNPCAPLLRNTRTSVPFAVSTTAARSIHPSLSKSMAVMPQPFVASVMGSGTRSKLLAIHIAPQADPRRAGMRQRNVHPAVFVEVEDVDAGSRGKSGRVVQRHRLEWPFALVQINRRRAVRSGHHQVHRAVVVDVGEHNAGRRALCGESGFLRPIRKRAIAVVAPHHVVGRVLHAAQCACP